MGGLERVLERGGVAHRTGVRYDNEPGFDVDIENAVEREHLQWYPRIRQEVVSKMTAKVVLSEAELNQHLIRQVSFLCRSVVAFDAGYEDEAYRIAPTMRLLLHHTGRSKSLFGQLGLFNKMLFRDTCKVKVESNTNGPFDGLTGFMVTGGGVAKAYPLKDNLPLEISILRTFDAWWKQPVIRDNNNTVFTRADLVLNIADTDGGAHVDPALDVAYASLTRENSMNWVILERGVPKPIAAPHLASVRQIAHELLGSIAHCQPDTFQDHDMLASLRSIDFTKIRMDCVNPGRNDPCPCGSGKKFKKCHIEIQSQAMPTDSTSTVSYTPTSIVVRKT